MTGAWRWGRRALPPGATPSNSDSPINMIAQRFCARFIACSHTLQKKVIINYQYHSKWNYIHSLYIVRTTCSTHKKWEGENKWRDQLWENWLLTSSHRGGSRPELCTRSTESARWVASEGRRRAPEESMHRIDRMSKIIELCTSNMIQNWGQAFITLLQ